MILLLSICHEMLLSAVKLYPDLVIKIFLEINIEGTVSSGP